MLTSHSNPRNVILLSLAAAFACTGCKPREIGVAFSDTQARKVDRTWVNAAKACWPALLHEGVSDEAISHQLADPLHFRAAFSPYSSYTDAELTLLVTRPVTQAPVPDTSLFANASGPVLSLEDAAKGAEPSPTSATSTQTHAALCAVHSGTPVGFK